MLPLFFPLARRPFSFLMMSFAGLVIVFGLQASFLPTTAAEMRVLAVPGEAIFTRSAAGHRILIDTGEGAETAGRLGALMPFYDRSLDAVLLTHTDRDHAGGLAMIIESFRVKLLLLPGSAPHNPAEQAILRLAQDQGIPIVFLHPQTDLRVGELVFDTVAPTASVLGQMISKSNAASAVIRLSGAEKSVLLTGDLEKAGEKTLLKTPARLQADYLKVAHHGSKTSSTADFLAAVQPNEALIAVASDNPFGHPHQEALDRLVLSGSLVRQTADEGEIHFSLSP